MPGRVRQLFHGFPTSIIILLVAFWMPGASAETRRIDDTNGDNVTGVMPSYHGSWMNSTASDCSLSWCSSAPLNLSDVADQTWHSTDDPGAILTLTFIGTSVSVFFIVPTSGEPTSADFSLDGGMFTAHFDGPSQNGGLGPYLYNTTSCEINGLANKTHTLEVSSSAGTMLVFDYAQYMIDSPPPTATTSISASPPTVLPSAISLSSSGSSDISSKTLAQLLGAILGGGGGLAILLFLLCRWRPRRRSATGDVIPDEESKVVAYPVVATTSRAGETFSADRVTSPASSKALAMARRAIYSSRPPIVGGRALATPRRGVVGLPARPAGARAVRSAAVPAQAADQENGEVSPTMSLSAASEDAADQVQQVPAEAMNHDPYFVLLNSELERLRVVYADGAPPTYPHDDLNSGDQGPNPPNSTSPRDLPRQSVRPAEVGRHPKVSA